MCDDVDENKMNSALEKLRVKFSGGFVGRSGKKSPQLEVNEYRCLGVEIASFRILTTKLAQGELLF